MNSNNKKILVTGGSGFIGTNYIEYLLKISWRILLIWTLTRRATLLTKNFGGNVIYWMYLILKR